MTVSSGDIFLSATDVRNNARTFLIIHQEARAIEDAILCAADSGLLTAYVYNTYMTQTHIPHYKTITSSTVATGTVSNPTFTVGQQIIIDGQTVTLTGTTLTQTVTDINTAAVPNVTASQANGNLVLTDATGANIITSGNAATTAGLAATTAGVINTLTNTFKLINHGFQNGDEVILQTTGNLPAGLTAGLPYFVLLIDSNDFQLCSSYMDVINHNPVTLGTAGTGTLTIRYYSPQERYYDAWVGNGNADANRPLIDQMNGVMTYFTNFGYTITQQQNPRVTEGDVFQWILRW